MTLITEKAYRNFDRLDRRITAWMADNGVTLLRVSLGIVYTWFGALKFFPGLSPAADLATRTIEKLTLGMIPADTALILLAAWETVIGLGLLAGVGLRLILLLLFAQMAGTITPVFFFPAEVFQVFPIAPTLEGQYIIKNLVIISAALVIGATVRGGRVISQPEAAKAAEKIEEDSRFSP